MTDVFLTVLRMSLTGSAVILAVLLVRLCLKKAPKGWSWALWLIVLFRLLTPFGIPVKVPMPEVRLPALFGAEAGTEEAALPGYSEPLFDPEERYDRTELFPWYTENRPSSEPSASVPDGGIEFEAVPGTALSETPVKPEPEPEEPPSEEPVLGPFGLDSRQTDRILSAAAVVWIAGAAAMIVWNLVSFALLMRKLREAVPIGGNLRETDRVDTSFVVGLIRPKIYLPTGLSTVEQACVAEHERAHIRRLDPLWRLLSFAALTVHWFNPLVWLAFRLSGRDMEMSCDEAVLKRAPIDIRAAYSKTLLRFASHGRSAGPVLAFGEGETGSRVKNVMKYKKPVLWVSVAAGLVLVLSAVVLAVNLTARDTSLLNTVYAVKKGTFPALEEDEPSARLMEGMSSLRYMLAGDGSFYVRGSDSEAWDYNGKPEVWIEDGKIVSDLIRDIASPEDLSAMIRETSGVEVGRIADARVLLTEPYSPNHSVYTAFFSTTNGKTWYAFIGGRENLERGNVLILLELAPEAPVSGDDSGFFANSLRTPVMTLLSWEVESEVFIYNSITDAAGRSIQLFLAGEDLYEHIGQPDNDTPFHFGIAVFLPEAEGKGMRLADCAICPDVTVTRLFRYAGTADPAEPGTVRRDGDDFVFLTEDGQSIRASLTLPERKKTFHGKTEYVGECSIRFPGSAEEAYEVPAFLDALPYTRYSVDEVLYFWRDLTPEQTERFSAYRFEISGDCSLWVSDGGETWTCIGKGTLNPIVENRSAGEWILDQTGVDVDLVKESRLFSGQMNYGWILFSTRDGGFYAAMLSAEGESDPPECRSLLRLRCETEPGNRLWIDGEFAEHTLQSALERDVHVFDLHTVYPSGIAVVPFVTGMTWKDISGLVIYDGDKTACQIGAAVFELGSRSARLLKWAVCGDVSFTGWYTKRDMITCEFPSDDTILFTLPDGAAVNGAPVNGAIVRADLTLPERKSRFFGLIEQKQLVGKCSVGFRVDGVPNPADPSAEEPAEDGTDAAPDQSPYPDLDLLSPRRESWKLFPYKEGMAEYIRLVPDQAGLTEEKLAAVDSELLMKREDGEYWIFDYLYGDGWTGEDALACLAIGPGELAAVDVFQKSGNTFEGTLTDPGTLTALFDAIAQSDVMTRTLWADEIGWSERSQTEEGHAAEKILELKGRYGKVARLFFYPHADLMWLGDSAVALPRGEGETLLGLFEDALGREDAAENAPLEPSDGTREQIDAAYDAFLAERYDPNSWMDAAFATRKIDLDRDGADELVVYRCPALSGYPLDIYEWDPSKGEIRAFSTAVKDVPASLNALPGGTFTAEIGGHDVDKPDGFYGDFFSVNGQTYLISKTTSDSYIKFECYAFSNVRGSLAAAKIFSSEWFGEWYAVESRRKTVLINGEEIPFEDYGDALLAWRSSWNNVPGGGDIILWSEPLWSEEEVSGWPVAWLPPLSEEAGTGEIWTAPDGLFTLMIPAGWEEEILITHGAWTEDGDLWIDFYDRRDYEGENGWGGGLLGSLVLYAHRLDRMYPTNHQELKTVTYPDGRVFDLTLVYPGDLQCSPTNAGHYDYELTRFRKTARTAEFPEGCETSRAPERAALWLADQLKIAYENVFGPFEPLGTDPSPVENEVWLRYAITRLTVSDGRFTGAWEDDEFYWFPVLGNFAVDKKGGGIYRTYEKAGTVSGAIRFVPFDPYDPNAFGELGNTEPEGQSETHSEGPSQGQTDAGPEGGTLWTSPTGLFSLGLPEGFLDAVEVRTGEQRNGEFAAPEYWATFVLKDPGGWDGVLGSLVLYPHMLERYYLTGRQEFSTLTFADGGSFEFVFVLPEDPARLHPSYPLGIAAYYLSQLRTAAASAMFPESTRVTVPPGNAAGSLGSELIKAYVNTYGHEPDLSIAEDPSPCPDEEYLCYAINRILTGTLGAKGAWEDENYYWYPVIFPFAVDKETGAIYKVYNGLETVFTPFDPYAPDALAFAG